jgi:2-hydroxychromene-2-carboxylate isomerase
MRSRGQSRWRRNWRHCSLPNGCLILGAPVGSLSPDAVMRLGADPRWTTRRTADTQAALDRGVFGAPSYVIGDEIFWGQDRLDFVDRKLARGE